MKDQYMLYLMYCAQAGCMAVDNDDSWRLGDAVATFQEFQELDLPPDYYQISDVRS